MRDFRQGMVAHSRSFFREPLNVALLVALPLLAIELYSQAFGTFHAGMIDARLLIQSRATSAEVLGYVTGAIFATATLAGVLGLFQVLSARAADRRLGICGVSTPELLGSRLAATLLITLLIADVSLVWLSLITDVARPLVAFGALALAGVIYALIGMLVGSLLPSELEGSLVLVVLADVDNVFAAGIVGDGGIVAKVLPLHYPFELFQAAIVGGTIEPGHAVYAGAYALVLFGVALLAYRRATARGSA